ncbi:MAG: hypothetical protein AB7F88_14240 [Pyrinomonadaceae bacterium]
MIVSALAVFLSGVLAGCGVEADRSSQKNANEAVTAGNSAVVSNAIEPGTGARTNSNLDGEGNAPVEDPRIAERNRKAEAKRLAAANMESAKPDIEALLRGSARPAPEDSEFSVALADIVVERRTFLKHPMLSRVEKISDGAGSKITVTMRDGRTVALPGNAIEKISVASAVSILRAAGIDVPPSQPSDRKPRADRN